jgi:hypothetical protein
VFYVVCTWRQKIAHVLVVKYGGKRTSGMMEMRKRISTAEPTLFVESLLNIRPVSPLPVHKGLCQDCQLHGVLLSTRSRYPQVPNHFLNVVR